MISFSEDNLLILTRQFLVLAGEGVLLFAGLLKLMGETLYFGRAVTQVALRLLVQGQGFVQTGFKLDVDAFQVLHTFLQLPGGVVGLLQIDDEDLHFGLEAGLLLLQVVHLDDQRLDVFLLFLEALGVLASVLEGKERMV